MAITGYRTKLQPGPKEKELQRLIEQWREKGLHRVRSCEVVPDSSNRGHTGLSIDHVHFIASSILKKGFRARDNFDVQNRIKVQPHDIPVLVRGNSSCAIAAASLKHWTTEVTAEPKFPKIVLDGAKDFFTSLGNGHFTQALNLFRHQHESKFTGKPFVPPKEDNALHHALEHGVESIVLRQETPIDVRRKIATLLNDTHEYKWGVDVDGAVDISPENSYFERFTQFEAQAKVADSEALSALVQLELGILSDEGLKPDEEVLEEKLLSRL